MSSQNERGEYTPKEPTDMNWFWWILGALAIAALLWWFFFRPQAPLEPQGRNPEGVATVVIEETREEYLICTKDDPDDGFRGKEYCLTVEDVKRLKEVWESS